MMDAYIPICDTVRPSISVSANDEPWHPLLGTQTLYWFVTPAPAYSQGLSSVNQAVHTFVILDHPAAAGLERLRTFKGWADNWDAEGGKAPDADTVDFATKVFSLLAVHNVPNITLGTNGHPMFLYNGKIKGEVIVTSGQTIDYFFADDEAPEGEDVLLSDGFLPEELVGYIRASA
jgi:hypothetical protein